MWEWYSILLCNYWIIRLLALKRSIRLEMSAKQNHNIYIYIYISFSIKLADKMSVLHIPVLTHSHITKLIASLNRLRKTVK